MKGMLGVLWILFCIFFVYFGFVFFSARVGGEAGEYGSTSVFGANPKSSDALEGSIREDISRLHEQSTTKNSDGCKTMFKKGFGRVVVVGAGPVGSFISVLAAYLGIPVTCYEKRKEFTRKTKLNITKGFFGKVQRTLDNLGVRSSFFEEMNRHLRTHDNKIVISELEQMLCNEAMSTGKFEYKTAEVESFSEVYEMHKKDNPVILDCTGRNSNLRKNEFGDDSENIFTTPLQHAIYINLRAKYKKPVNLYSAMKDIEDVVLTNITVGDYRADDTFTNVTIPIFISEDLACVFENHYPNTNKRPFNPFGASCDVPDRVLYPIFSIIGSLVLEDWVVDFDSVEVKQIEISCGYAMERSCGRYVCLGDSAVHLAFFRSLNLGLKHALEFFVGLSTYCGEPRGALCESWVMEQFVQDNMHLNTIRVYKTKRRNSYMVVTKTILYECFHYCLTDRRTERLTDLAGIYESQIDEELSRLNARLCDWNNVRCKFESRRKSDIESEVQSNLDKNDIYKYISWIINVNESSPIKISEEISVAHREYFLPTKCNLFFFKYFKILKHENAPSINHDDTVRIILGIINECRVLDRNEGSVFTSGIRAVKDAALSIVYGRAVMQDRFLVKHVTVICEDSNTSAEEKLVLIKNFLESGESPPWNVELRFVKKLVRNVLLHCEQCQD